MNPMSPISRRALLGSAGASAVALGIPGVVERAGAVSAARQDAPRLPLRILDRGNLPDESARAIAALSDQITIAKDGKSLTEAAVIFGGLNPDELKTAANLRWVQFPAAGVEAICFPEFVESDVCLTNAQGCYAPEIAEHAFGLLFALTRGIAYHARQRAWGYTPQPLELRGMTLGIIGLGGIGREIARRAKAMDMHVVAVDAEPLYVERFAMAEDVRLVDDGLDWLLGRSDVVVMAAPLTSRSRGMLGEKQFSAMKAGAYFLNVSRGKTVQTPALMAALKSGRLGGAGLDVTDPEPLPADHELWQMDNVIITSHIAGRSQFGRQRVHNVFVENVRRWINSQPLVNLVDKQKGY
jgi:D-2-hydroxyacid dehydrogenase (NADP+)